MKKILFFLFIITINLTAVAQETKPLQVVTTTTVLHDFVQILGGEFVRSEHLLKPFVDPHLITIKPGDLSKLRSSDLFVKVGGDEEEWTIDAVESSGNLALIVIDASTGVRRTGVPSAEELKKAGGAHLHKSGNPYYWMNPGNVRFMLDNILEGLAFLRPKQVSFFVQNRDRYLRQLNDKILDWNKRIAFMQKEPIVTYHESWTDFAQKFGLNVFSQVEPQPGIAPSIGYLNQLIQKMKKNQVKIIMVEPYYRDKKFLTLVSGQTQAKVAVLPMALGKEYKVPHYLDLMEHNINTLVRLGTRK